MIEIKDEIRPRKELARSKEARMKDEEDREGRGRREEFDSFTTSKGEYGSRVESGGDSEREKEEKMVVQGRGREGEREREREREI